jgi:hypothetical protein
MVQTPVKVGERNDLCTPRSSATRTGSLVRRSSRTGGAAPRSSSGSGRRRRRSIRPTSRTCCSSVAARTRRLRVRSTRPAVCSTTSRRTRPTRQARSRRRRHRRSSRTASSTGRSGRCSSLAARRPGPVELPAGQLDPCRCRHDAVRRACERDHRERVRRRGACHREAPVGRVRDRDVRPVSARGYGFLVDLESVALAPMQTSFVCLTGRPTTQTAWTRSTSRNCRSSAASKQHHSLLYGVTG